MTQKFPIIQLGSLKDLIHPSKQFSIMIGSQHNTSIPRNICKRYNLQRLHPLAILHPLYPDPIYTYVQKSSYRTRFIIPSKYRKEIHPGDNVNINPLPPSGFFTTIKKGNTFTIPSHIVKKRHLLKDDIIKIIIPHNHGKITFTTKFRSYNRNYLNRKRNFYPDHNAIIPRKLQDQFIIQSKYYVEELEKAHAPDLMETQPLPGHIDLGKIISQHPDLRINVSVENGYLEIRDHSKSRSQPVTVPRYIKLDPSMVEHFGLYLSDGGRKHRIWFQAASTPEQAQLVISQHIRLIADSSLGYSITYTKPNDDERSDAQIRKEIRKRWIQRLPILEQYPTKSNVHIMSSKRTKTEIIKTKWNSMGTINFWDGRSSIQKIYRLLLEYVLKEIVNKNQLIYAFLRGVIEGDGSPSLRYNTFSSIRIYLKPKDSIKVRDLLKLVGIYPTLIKQGKLLTICISKYIYALQLIKNQIFHLYPKRKKRLLSGIQNHIATRILFLLIKHNTIPKHTLKKLDYGAFTYLYFLKKTNALVDSHLIEINDDQIKITSSGEDIANFLKLLFP